MLPFSQFSTMKLLVLSIYLTAGVYAQDYYSSNYYDNPYGNSEESTESSGNCKAGQISSTEEESCCDRPVGNEHTQISCISFSPTCWVICEEGYTLPGAQAATQVIDCKDGAWMAGEQKFKGVLCQKTHGNSTSGKKMVNERSAAFSVSQEDGRKKRSSCNLSPRINNAVLTCSWQNQDTEWVCSATCKKDHFFRDGHSSILFADKQYGWEPVHSNKPLHFYDTCFSRCNGKKVPPEETLGLVQVHSRARGQCTNTKPVKDMIVCEGRCDSFETYTIGEHGIRAAASNCTCCRPTFHTKTVMVEVTCDVKPKPMRIPVAVPTECECAPCSSSMAIQDRPALKPYEFNEQTQQLESLL